VPIRGGLSQNSLWDATPYGVNARGLYAMSDGIQGVNHSGSSVTLIGIMMGGHWLEAQYIKVDAYAKNQFLGVSASGTTGIAQLIMDGQNIAISGAPNQRIDFPGGYLLINEQEVSGDGRGSGAITVNGLRFVIEGEEEVTVCSSRAAVTKPSY
jgi:hypothetical protein